MQTDSSHAQINVSEIDSGDRRLLEHLLGTKLLDDQQVYIAAFTPGVVPDDASRLQAADRIMETIAQAGEHADRLGVTADEIDAAVDEATEHLRYGKS